MERGWPLSAWRPWLGGYCPRRGPYAAKEAARSNSALPVRISTEKVCHASTRHTARPAASTGARERGEALAFSLGRPRPSAAKGARPGHGYLNLFVSSALAAATPSLQARLLPHSGLLEAATGIATSRYTLRPLAFVVHTSSAECSTAPAFGLTVSQSGTFCSGGRFV